VANAFDVIIIGAGTGGYPAAIRAAQLGLKVAVVERQKTLGGTCLNWGCIPTKALLEHAHALKIAQASKEWGLILGDQPARIDMNQVQGRKDKIVTILTRGVEFLFKKNNITWIKGSARLAGPGTVDVTGDEKAVRGVRGSCGADSARTTRWTRRPLAHGPWRRRRLPPGQVPAPVLRRGPRARPGARPRCRCPRP